MKNSKIKADIILKSDAIYDGVSSKTYPGGIAITGNKISAIGSKDEIDKYCIDQTTIIDCNDKLIVPGFIDSHMHFFDGAIKSSGYMCDEIANSKSEDDAIEVMKKYWALHPTENRLRGIGWFFANWDNKKMPSKLSLDIAFPNIPVYMIAADLHTIWMNSAALCEAGYTKDFVPKSGKIGKFKNGELSGVVYEPDACLPAMEKIMHFDDNEMECIIKHFVDCLHIYGITSTADMCAYDYNEATIKKMNLIQKMLEDNKINIRLHVYTALHGYTNFNSHKKMKELYNDEKLQISGVKGFIDGVTSTYTALLNEPYADMPDSKGQNAPIESYSNMKKYITAANANNLPVRLHCIGDGAVGMALNLYLESITANNNYSIRNTIEHIETISPEDIPRFKQLNVIPSMQPMHLLLDAGEKIMRCGINRCRMEWPHKSIINAEADIAFGSDYPVVEFNPIDGIYAAVTRKYFNGDDAGVNMNERLSVSEALKAYTYGGAKVFGRENEIGSLQVGNFADIVVLDKNIFFVAPNNIRDVAVELTIEDGKIVFEKSSKE